MQEIIRKVETAYTEGMEALPEIFPGDMVNVHVKLKERNKERVQQFQGTVVRVKGGMRLRSVTLRKLTGEVAVERVFMLPSPAVAKVEVKRRAKVRRAFLSYLRKFQGGAKAKIKYRLARSGGSQ